MPIEAIESWGRLTSADHDVSHPTWRADIARTLSQSQPTLPCGLRRSYGDVSLNAGHGLVDMRSLDRFIDADWSTGVVRVEAGMSLDALLKVCVPRGWFVPVTPGTKYVTVGGMIANDVHGKNHPTAGSFGHYVRRMAIQRSDRGLVECDTTSDVELFRATIGGLGLTGIIVWAEISLHRVESSFLDTETLRFAHIDRYFDLVEQSRNWPYAVAWVDCLSSGSHLGQGLFTRARWSTDGRLEAHNDPKIGIPIVFPSFALNRYSIGAFNMLYRNRPAAFGSARVHYSSFFHPLDGVMKWNRMYGPRGFYQHQSVIPHETARQTISAMLEITAKHRLGSFLIVVKEFGDRTAPGLLSFPRPGTTFALDFPNGGDRVREVLLLFADMAVAAGGRLYPAKDAIMTTDHFASGFPNWHQLETARDPNLSSDFWRRITKAAT